MLRTTRIAALLLTLAVASQALAQQAGPPPQSEADQRLEAMLSEADLFFKKNYFEGGQRWEYKIAWTENGETTMMSVYLRSIGNRANGDPIYVVYAWAQVSSISEGEQLSPAVIKVVAALNDNLLTGNFSTAKFGVFANTSIVLDNVTSQALRTTLWDMHYNALFLKKKLAELS